MLCELCEVGGVMHLCVCVGEVPPWLSMQAAQARKEEKKRQEKEKMMLEDDPEKTRKWEVGKRSVATPTSQLADHFLSVHDRICCVCSIHNVQYII